MFFGLLCTTYIFFSFAGLKIHVQTGLWKFQSGIFQRKIQGNFLKKLWMIALYMNYHSSKFEPIWFNELWDINFQVKNRFFAISGPRQEVGTWNLGQNFSFIMVNIWCEYEPNRSGGQNDPLTQKYPLLEVPNLVPKKLVQNNVFSPK